MKICENCKCSLLRNNKSMPYCVDCKLKAFKILFDLTGINLPASDFYFLSREVKLSIMGLLNKHTAL